jgi:hypothetical protein|tara:strand:- start:647 stop:793 length:147 start_codon:yes stop_codon:yes gene_type:complete
MKTYKIKFKHILDNGSNFIDYIKASDKKTLKSYFTKKGLSNIINIEEI